MTFLRLDGVQKRFPGGVVAVRDFDLSVERGEFISFLGPSGCGKTTTLRMIAASSSRPLARSPSKAWISPGRRPISATSGWSSSPTPCSRT